ncbi:MAG: Pyruvate kinase [Chlamydiales bacterium]|nr:Pyruvate kinase [Chlamydiales bacterium]
MLLEFIHQTCYQSDMDTRTKIVCTMGPAVSSLEKIEQLIDAGMNVARLNFSHGTHEEHGRIIELLKQARQKKQIPLSIMLDTKGPEIRLGKLKEDRLVLEEKQQLWLIKEEVEGDKDQITLTPAFALDFLKKDTVVLLDDGYIITRVVEIAEKGVKVEVEHGGVIKSARGVNIPGSIIDLPALTEKDEADIRFGCEQDVDWIAASFIRSAEHVVAIKKVLEDLNKSDIDVIAKIENSQGVQNFDSIVQVADAIMVARGDLGVELPLTQVPRLQKMMIRKCFLGAKPSVTATQMLESMIVNPRPTRAEASDVANAIYDSTSAVMLSGETAIGKYPTQAVKVMKAIIEEAEDDFGYYDFFKRATQRGFYDVPSSVAGASINTAYSAHAKAIFAFTTSGSTARLLSRFRPEMPIIAMTPLPKVYNQLALTWGVTPILCEQMHDIETAKKQISEYALEKGLVQYGDLVVITAGTPFGKAGSTNMMIVDSIGDVLVRGSEGVGTRVHGRVLLHPSPDETEYSEKDLIIVINNCDKNYLHLLKHTKGVILQNHVDDIDSENYLRLIAEKLEITAIFRAEGASGMLCNGQLVTLDPTQSLVYKGSL